VQELPKEDSPKEEVEEEDLPKDEAVSEEETEAGKFWEIYIYLKLQPHPPYMHTCMHACMIQEACGASGATKEEDQKDPPEDDMKEDTVY